MGLNEYKPVSSGPVREGCHELRVEFEPTGKPDFAAGTGAPGRAQLYIDGQLAGQAEFPVTTPIALNPGGLPAGRIPGRPWWGTTGRRSPSAGRCTP